MGRRREGTARRRRSFPSPPKPPARTWALGPGPPAGPVAGNCLSLWTRGAAVTFTVPPSPAVSRPRSRLGRGRPGVGVTAGRPVGTRGAPEWTCLPQAWPGLDSVQAAHGGCAGAQDAQCFSLFPTNWGQGDASDGGNLSVRRRRDRRGLRPGPGDTRAGDQTTVAAVLRGPAVAPRAEQGPRGLSGVPKCLWHPQGQSGVPKCLWCPRGLSGVPEG